MNHRFESSSKSHQLVARARQFSSFIMIVGNMADASTLEPKDAIIVLNKVCDRFVACIDFLHFGILISIQSFHFVGRSVDTVAA